MFPGAARWNFSEFKIVSFSGLAMAKGNKNFRICIFAGKRHSGTGSRFLSAVFLPPGVRRELVAGPETAGEITAAGEAGLFRNLPDERFGAALQRGLLHHGEDGDFAVQRYDPVRRGARHVGVFR